MHNLNRVYIETLGCAKNQVDTEVMVGILSSNEYEMVGSPEHAHIIIVNTCGFIESAKKESIDTIFDLLEWKNSGDCKLFIVAGCLAQRYAGELKEELPEVDMFVGTTKFNEILSIVKNYTAGIFLEDINKTFTENMPRVLSTPSYYAFLKIAEGCDNFCTYCIIPKLRGKYRSREMESIVDEAKELAKGGVKELIIIAQDVTMYGKDLYGDFKLSDLLYRLNEIEGIEWIRLQYCYPDSIDDRLIKAVAECDKVVKYIDIPIQHGSNSVLKRMNRNTDKESIERIVNGLREAVPGIVIRTTVIVGFPGETDDNFEELLDFIKRMKFDRLGAFKYSKEEGTPAALLDGQVAEEVKEERHSILMSAQMDISSERMASFTGKALRCVIEEKVDGEDVYIARSEYDTPEVDGVVYVHTDRQLSEGDMVIVRITDALEYDLIGEC
jgi:ribosomal protein S12 methylthiotransferase